MPTGTDVSTELAHETGFGTAGWTPERRERQSEAAKRLIAEGRLGGAANGRLGGRPRKPRMQEFLAEEARKNAGEINRALEAMLRSGDNRLKLEAIRQYAAAEDWTEKHQREEERDLLNLRGEELDHALKAALAEVLGVDISLLDAIDVPDADVVEDAVGVGADSA